MILVGLFAFAALDASSLAVADVGFLADASRFAWSFLAFLGHLRFAVDQIRQRGAAAGQAVQLGGHWIVDVGLAVAVAFVFCNSFHDVSNWRLAVGGSHALALSVLQESFLTEASDHAVLGADRARVGVGASGWAGGAAGVENFVLTAFVRRQHHGLRELDMRAL